MQKSFIVSLIVAVLLIVLVLQNSGTAEVQFYFWKIEAPLMLLLFLVILLGALVSSLLSFSSIHKKRKDLRQANKKIADLEAQLKVKSAQLEKKVEKEKQKPQQGDETQAE